MVAWHRSWMADIGLRLLGLFSCGIAYAAFSHLSAMCSPASAPGVFAYALAVLGFLSASAGAALTFLGHHLFDQIEVSSRWRKGSAKDAAVREGHFHALGRARVSSASTSTSTGRLRHRA